MRKIPFFMVKWPKVVNPDGAAVFFVLSGFFFLSQRTKKELPAPFYKLLKGSEEFPFTRQNIQPPVPPFKCRQR